MNLWQVTRVTVFETIRRAVDEGDNDEHRAIAVAALSAGNTPASLTIIHRNSPALLSALQLGTTAYDARNGSVVALNQAHLTSSRARPKVGFRLYARLLANRAFQEPTCFA